jgi:hypothetical protein
MSRYDYQGRTEQAKAAHIRLKDAKILFNNRCWRGSMYLAGYYVECLLKFKLMERFGVNTIRQLNEKLEDQAGTHNLEVLLRMTDAQERLRQSRVHWFAFNTCSKWKTSWRYDPSNGQSDDAEEFLEAVVEFGRFIQGSI